MSFDDFDALLKVQYAKGDGEGVVFHNSNGDNPLTVAVEKGGEATKYEEIQSGLLTRPEKIEAIQSTLKMEWDLSDTLSVTSLTGFMTHNFSEINDDDGSLRALLHQHARTEQEQFTQELQAHITFDKFDAVIGAFYIDETVDGLAMFENTHVLNSFGIPGRFGTFNRTESDLESYAIFSHVNYEINEQFEISFGLSYTEDKRRADLTHSNSTFITGDQPFDFTQVSNHLPLFGDFATPTQFATPSIEGKWDEITGDISLQYHLNDDVMLYGSFARGFKGGSFNTLITTVDQLKEVAPETVDAIEIGFKSTWYDGALTLNGSAYLYDYQNFQAFEYVTVGNQAVSVLFAVPESEVYGAELQLTYLASENFGFDLGLGYTKSEVTDIGQAPEGVQIKNGNEFRNAPALNFNGAVWYYMALSENLAVTPQLDFTFVDEYFSSFANEPASTAGDYWQVNARVRFSDINEQYVATVWVENLLDDELLSGRFPGNQSAFGSDFATAGPQRTFGVTVEYNF